MIRLSKRRRGMTSVFEAVTCLVMFAMLLMMLLSTMSYANIWTLKEHQEFIRRTNTDLLIEELQTDIKSAELIGCTETSIEIIQYQGEMVQYQIIGDAIYRNSEKILDGINTGSFVEGDGTSVGLYLRLNEGDDIIETTLYK